MKRQRKKTKAKAIGQPVRSARFAQLALLLICAGGLAIGLWRFWPYTGVATSARSDSASIAVPEVQLADVDPTAAETLRPARERVLKSPNSADAWGRYGMLLHAYEFSADSAEVCFAQAARLDPNEPRWPYYRGVVLSVARPAEAIGLLEHAETMLGNRGTAARLRLAELLLSQDRLDDAERVLEKLLRNEPTNAWAILTQAKLALRRQNAGDAQRLVKPVTTDPRVRKGATTVLAQAELALANADASRAAAAQAADLPPDPTWPDSLLEEIGALRTGLRAHLARADSFLAQDRAAEAIASLEGTLKSYPESDWAWLLLGRAHLQCNDFDEAEAALRKAVELKPSSVEAIYYLGTVHLLRENHTKAADWYRKAIAHKPDFAMAHYNLGHCLWRMQDEQAAIEQFRETIAAKPNYAPAHLELATLLAKDGQTAEALSEAKLALQLNPNDNQAQALIRKLEAM